MKITTVIVTYANRHGLCEQVITSAFNEGVANIILVDNASATESAQVYEQMALEDKRIQLIRHNENLGSAGGFKAGLKFVAQDLQTDFIWLLDDDNVPQVGSLTALISTWNMLAPLTLAKDVVLYSYRGDTRANDLLAVTQGYLKCYLENNFMGFNFLQAVKLRLRKYKTHSQINYPVVRVFLGPYGGAFLSLEIVEKIGSPSEEFFVYADDHEYTNRINSQGINQYLVYTSVLKDVDESFDQDGYLSKKVSEVRVYYSIRNHVFLSKKYIKNRLFYNFNKFIFCSLIFKKIIYIFLKDREFAQQRLALIKKSILDGESGKLGRTLL
jgi:GT2 family glycosyltransferase